MLDRSASRSLNQIFVVICVIVVFGFSFFLSVSLKLFIHATNRDMKLETVVCLLKFRVEIFS